MRIVIKTFINMKTVIQESGDGVTVILSLILRCWYWLVYDSGSHNGDVLLVLPTINESRFCY